MFHGLDDFGTLHITAMLGPHARHKRAVSYLLGAYLTTYRAQVQAAAEVVMLSHFGGYFCGACDCLDVLAGQVLT